MKTFPALPQFGTNRTEPPASQQPVFGPRLAAAPAAADTAPSPRPRYQRSPFYLKIEGLTGPRPKYDEYGRLVSDEV